MSVHQNDQEIRQRTLSSFAGFSFDIAPASSIDSSSSSYPPKSNLLTESSIGVTTLRPEGVGVPVGLSSKSAGLGDEAFEDVKEPLLECVVFQPGRRP